ncbi:MAG TPA: hypothetical protein VGQ76_08545 [Thermoanaerobaculia bacterium]|jgi:hypothetical protein|nr:hypothetical protein [Thermoanaerobaculia bacterium]
MRFRISLIWVVVAFFGIGCDALRMRESAQTIEPLSLVSIDEAAAVLGTTDTIKVFAEHSPSQNARSFRYVATNNDSLTVSIFLKDGKSFYDLQTFGKDYPERFGKKEPCEGIGTDCYRPHSHMLHVLHDDLCINLQLEATRPGPTSFNLGARDDLARKITRRIR